MKTIGQVLKLSVEYLQMQKSHFSRLEVEWLIAGVLKVGRLDLYLKYDQPLHENELEQIRRRLRRLAQGEPLQYIEQEVVFCGCHLYVDNRVLIPRPETELLVEYVQRCVTTQNLTLVDACTGSGCIGIACKKKSPYPIDVKLLDICKDALTVARENAKRACVEVQIVQSDLLEALPDHSIDILVSNPPYVSELEYENLELHVRDFEPKKALVSGPTGIEMYERLVIQIHKKVRPEGVVWFELGEHQQEALQNLLAEHGYKNVSFVQDFSKKARFVSFSC